LVKITPYLYTNQPQAQSIHYIQFINRITRFNH